MKESLLEAVVHPVLTQNRPGGAGACGILGDSPDAIVMEDEVAGRVSLTRATPVFGAQPTIPVRWGCRLQ